MQLRFRSASIIFGGAFALAWTTIEADSSDVCSDAAQASHVVEGGPKDSSTQRAALLQRQSSQASTAHAAEESYHPGAVAALTEEGYSDIVNLGRDGEMETFARRVVDSMGLEITDDHAFHAFAKELNLVGEAPETLKHLKEEIMTASGARGTWAAFPQTEQTAQVSGGSASLTQAGFHAVQALHCGHETELFVQRVAKSRGLKITDPAKLHDLVVLLTSEKAKFSTLLTHLGAGHKGSSAWLETASSISPPRDEPPDAGEEDDDEAEPDSATLSSGGHETNNAVKAAGVTNQEVAPLLDEALADSGIETADSVSAGAGSGRAPEQRFAEAGRETVAYSRHQRVAQTAALDELGYAKVASMKDKSAMKTFLERAASKLGYRVLFKGGIEGMVPYYDGQKGMQSYAALKADLARTAKKRNTWLMSMDAPAVNVETQEGEDDEVEDEANVKKTYTRSKTARDAGPDPFPLMQEDQETGASSSVDIDLHSDAY